MRLDTERLLIRDWTLDDAPEVLDIHSRAEVVRWLGDEDPPRLMGSLDEARERIERWRSYEEPPEGMWAVQPHGSPRAVGSVLLLPLPKNEHGEVEIGWHLHPDAWGHGYATEAARAVLAHGFAGGLLEIHAVTHLDNHPSIGVCRKLGMRELGITEKWYDAPSRLFRITRDEWVDGRH